MSKFEFPSASDLSAGILVALVGIPQCLAYAMLSGLPPMYGLVTAAVPGLVAAALGRSAHVTVGPTNTTGLVILTSLTAWASQPELLLVAMATLTALAGLSRLAIVVFRAERIFDFVPESVMCGFSTGAALIIGLMQFDELLGLPFSGVKNVVDEISLITLIMPSEIKLTSLGLALTALIAVLLGRKFFPRWPVPLLTLLTSVALVEFDVGGISSGNSLIKLEDMAQIADQWPAMANRFPSLDMVQSLIIPGFAVAFIGSLELIITLRKGQEQRWFRDELRSQGIANLIGSFTGSFPASTSLTRSVLLELGGAKTRWAPFIAASVTLPVIFFGGAFIRNIPQAAIAGLLVATSLSMIRPKEIVSMFAAGGATRWLYVATTAATLLVTFHEAIVLGVCLGICIFLLQASQPQLSCMMVTGDGWLSSDNQISGEHCVVQVSGSLFFAAARQLPERLEASIPVNVKRVTLDLSHAHHSRVAALFALDRFNKLAQERKIDVEICGQTENMVRLSGALGVQLPWSAPRLRQYFDGRPRTED